MPTHLNTVGKVKNTKLYNFCLIRLFHSLHSIRPSLWKSRGYVATPYLSHGTTRETPATHIQLSHASSNHVIEHRPSSVHRFSQSFTTVKQITVPHVELTAITWQIMPCATVFVDTYGARGISPTQALTTLRLYSLKALDPVFNVPVSKHWTQSLMSLSICS